MGQTEEPAEVWGLGSPNVGWEVREDAPPMRPAYMDSNS